MKFKTGDMVQGIRSKSKRYVVGYGMEGELYLQHGAYYQPLVTTDANWELVPEPVKVSGWVNLYADGDIGPVYRTREEAASRKPQDWGTFKTIYVSGVEGTEEG